MPRPEGVSAGEPERAVFMAEAIRLSLESVRSGAGGPFGAVVVRGGRIVASGCNRVTSTNDPTAHAEGVAIRAACHALSTFQLAGCDLYTSCEPCPMCLGAIYWARPDNVYYANTQRDAAEIGFDDQFIYQELAVPINQRRLPLRQMMRDEALAAFAEWAAKQDTVRY